MSIKMSKYFEVKMFIFLKKLKQKILILQFDRRGVEAKILHKSLGSNRILIFAK